MMKPGWRHAGIAITLLLILTLIFYQKTVIYLVNMWTDFSVGEYGHGFLVVAISAYLIISNRKRLSKISPCPSYLLLPFVLLSSMIWFLALVVDVEMLQSVGLLLIILTTVWVIVGNRAMSLLAFPILFIGFAIPIWFPLSPILQDITADVVFWVTRFIEVPAFREENLIVVPAGIFSIEEACSGLRYLLAALTLGSLYSYMNYVTLPARIAVVLVAAAVAILANFLRVFIVVYLGYTTDMQHPWVHDHLMLGWYIFGGLVALMLFLDSRFYRHSGVVESNEAAVVTAPVPCNNPQARLFIVTLICAVLLLSGPAVVYINDNKSYPRSSDFNLMLPSGVKGWIGPAKSSNDWQPKYKGSVNSKMDYQKQLDVVSLYVAYYPRQRQGEEVINVKNMISDKKVWRLKYAHAHDWQLSDYKVKEQILEKSRSDKRLVWYWYDIGGKVTSNKYEAKVLQVVSLLTNKPDAKAFAVSVQIKQDLTDARNSLRDFVTQMKVPLADIQVIKK